MGEEQNSFGQSKLTAYLFFSSLSHLQLFKHYGKIANLKSALNLWNEYFIIIFLSSFREGNHHNHYTQLLII